MTSEDHQLRRPRRGLRIIGGLAIAGVVLAGAGGGFFLWERQPRTTPVVRGQALAAGLGCFNCHGEGGAGGVPNPGSALGEVPPFRAGGALATYVQSDADLREWIGLGRPRRLAAKKNRAGVLVMPAYGKVLDEGQVSDLVAYFEAVSGYRAAAHDVRAAAGRQLAERLGCFGCHGVDGRGGAPNPRSFKGYIPPWEGPDFALLVENEAELRAWILDGKIERFENNPLARFFTGRMVLKMPAYRDLLGPGELDALMTYIRALGTTGPVAALVAPPEDRGAWLYRRAGCVTCHGLGGEGGVENRNAPGEAVPGLLNLAESTGLFEASHRDAVAAALARGTPVASLSIPDAADIEARIAELRTVMIDGRKVLKHDEAGPEPPLSMPPWSQRMHADGGPVQRADVDAILAYLLRLAKVG